MRIANGVEMLELPMKVMGTDTIVCPALIRYDNSTILVDTGYPGQLNQIREAMEKSGMPFAGINKIIITHHDMDHIGGLSDILAEIPGKIEVIAHEEEKPYIQGEKNPTKLTQMEARLSSMSTEMRAVYESLKAGFKNHTAKVDTTVTDNEELPYCGGITVIYTPGHTVGHISLYLKQNKILITGDTLFVEGGMLVPAPLFVNYDNDLAAGSLKKLAQYDIEKIICYHGGLYDSTANKRIAELSRGI